MGRPFALALALWGAPMTVIGLWPNRPVAVAALFAVGVGNALLDVAGFTLMQRLGTDRSARSCVRRDVLRRHPDRRHRIARRVPDWSAGWVCDRCWSASGWCCRRLRCPGDEVLRDRRTVGTPARGDRPHVAGAAAGATAADDAREARRAVDDIGARPWATSSSPKVSPPICSMRSLLARSRSPAPDAAVARWVRVSTSVRSRCSTGPLEPQR